MRRAPTGVPSSLLKLGLIPVPLTSSQAAGFRDYLRAHSLRVFRAMAVFVIGSTLVLWPFESVLLPGAPEGLLVRLGQWRKSYLLVSSVLYASTFLVPWCRDHAQALAVIATAVLTYNLVIQTAGITPALEQPWFYLLFVGPLLTSVLLMTFGQRFLFHGFLGILWFGVFIWAEPTIVHHPLFNNTAMLMVLFGIVGGLYIGQFNYCAARSEFAAKLALEEEVSRREAAQAELLVRQEELEDRVVDRTKALLMLAKRISGTQEIERARIARDLHDHLGQALFALRLQMHSVTLLAPGEDIDFSEMQAIIDRMEGATADLIQTLRLPDLPREEFVPKLVEMVQNSLKRSQISATFRLDVEAPIEPALHATLYRISQEAVRNIHRHAHARDVSFRLACDGKVVTLRVWNNGVSPEGPDQSRSHFGILGMRERAELAGGVCSVEVSQEEGAVVKVVFPNAPHNT